MQNGGMPDFSDADLVADALGGDRAAFAAIYDRYSDRIHDFCWSLLRNRDDAADATQDTFVRATERLGQLRDPSLLRSWLYSIARREALAHLRARRKQVLDESLPETADQAIGPESAASQNELRDLVWDAAAGLADRDRVLLDLHLRQGLDGAELAEAAGVRANNVYVMLGRFRERVERSLGALLVARLGRADCAELDAILTGWDGRFSVLIRKRVARHVDSCTVCSERRRTAASPLALLSSVPIMTAPPELRDIVLQAFDERFSSDGGAGGSSGSGHSGGGIRRTHRFGTRAMVVAGVGVMTAAFIVGAAVLFSPDDTTTLVPGPAASTQTPGNAVAAPEVDPSTSGLGIGASATMTPGTTEDPDPTEIPAEPPAQPEPIIDDPPADDGPDEPVPPGELVVSASSVDLGAETTSSAVTLSNVGGTPIAYDIATQTTWLSVDHAAGELAGDSDRELVITADRAGLKEGDYHGAVVITSTAGSASVEVTLAVEIPPVIEQVTADRPGRLCTYDSTDITADVYDDSGVAAVALIWTRPDGIGGSKPMSSGTEGWQATLESGTERGELTWHVVATDVRGNTSASPLHTLSIEPCIG